MRRTLIALATLLLVAASASAEPMAPSQQQQLLVLFQRYNRAIEAGDVNQALALRTQAVQTALTSHLNTPQERTDFLNTSREMVPERLQPLHASVNDSGDKALLVLLATKTVSGRPVQDEFSLGFAREDGVWKLGGMAAGPGPADIKRCPDRTYQPVSAYAGGSNVSLAGRIENVEFLPDHTLVLLAAGDTEICAFLPDRAALQQHGLNPAIIQPWRVADISGVAAKTNPQKVMVNNITVHAEE